MQTDKGERWEIMKKEKENIQWEGENEAETHE